MASDSESVTVSLSSHKQRWFKESITSMFKFTNPTLEKVYKKEVVVVKGAVNHLAGPEEEEIRPWAAVVKCAKHLAFRLLLLLAHAATAICLPWSQPSKPVFSKLLSCAIGDQCRALLGSRRRVTDSRHLRI